MLWNSYTEFKFLYMQHIFVCLLLCLCVVVVFLFGAVLVCLIYLVILALKFIYWDDNLKYMFAFMILISLFVLLVSIRCKL